MLRIDCPWCGERDEVEFTYGGEAHRDRPERPQDLTDEEWADFLFMRTNTKGLYRERWNHAQGCRKWFNLVRDTSNHTIVGSYKPGTKPRIKELTGKKGGKA